MISVSFSSVNYLQNIIRIKFVNQWFRGYNLKFFLILEIEILDVCDNIEDVVVKVMKKSFQFQLFQTDFPSSNGGKLEPDIGENCDIFAGK